MTAANGFADMSQLCAMHDNGNMLCASVVYLLIVRAVLHIY